jgi:16S rRNA (guanine966-N2)-methyltransferase
MLRIIAGELGGRRLRAPGGMGTRPTSERVREALFSILTSAAEGAPFDGATVLDLYAGSGALGIEALSRGAAHATFVEQDAVACRTLRENLRGLGLDGRAQVVQRPVRAGLPQVLSHGPFHFIFADPPYASDELPWLLETLARARALAPRGCLVVERASRDADALADATPDEPAALVLADRRRYGDTALLFYHPSAGGDP